MWSKTKRNRKRKTRTKKKRNREQSEKGGAAADESAWIIYWELWHCLCFNLLLFVYVAIEKYWTEILQYDLLRECENAVSRGGGGVWREECEQLCLHCKFLPNFERKWIRLWRSILYFGYPLLWQTQRVRYDLPAEGICNGTLLPFAKGTLGMGEKFIKSSFKIDLVLWQRKRNLQFACELIPN